MLYVVQVFSSKEDKTIHLIKEIKGYSDVISDIFYPKRKVLKKFKGKLNEVEEIIYPGYIFIESERCEELSSLLFKVPTLTKLLGLDKKRKFLLPLFPDEEELLYSLMNKKHLIELSSVEVTVGKEINVISGPLKGLNGIVSKVNLHKRRVTVLMNLLGALREVELGINIISLKD